MSTNTMLSELVFGKKLNDITLADLEEFFSIEQEETSLLEFKSGEVSFDKIYREVSAFLNTEGGVLIIGTPREDDSSGKVKCMGELIPSKNKGKDRLMTAIVSNISPPPTELKIQELHSEGGSHFIIEVPQSLTPPHQCNRDGKYYIRMEGIANHAPHGVVEALFQRRQRSKLAPLFDIHYMGPNRVEIRTHIGNLSPYPAEKVFYSLEFYNIKSIPLKPGQSVVTHGVGAYTISHVFDMVLWKGLDFTYSHLIEHGPEPFFCSLTAWSKDAELVSCMGVFSSTTSLEFERYDAVEKKERQYFIDLVNRYKGRYL